MEKVINHAIIGCGRIAQNHYNAAKENNINIVCCCDIDIEKAKHFSMKNNIKEYISDYKELTNREDIDSISICTDHVSHTEIAKDFIENKHIIIEKPLSTNNALAKKFNELCKDTKKVISVIAQHRFDCSVNFVKKMIDNGDLGKIVLVNAKLKCHRDKEYYTESYWRGTLEKEGGSTVINQAFHIVDTLTYLFGLPIKVESELINIGFKKEIETEDTCAALLKYNDFLCCFSSTNSSITDWQTSIEVIGTKGEINFNIDFPENILEFNVSDDLKEKYKEDIKVISENHENNKNLGVNYYGLSHIKQFKDFKEAIITGRRPKVTIEKSMETLQVLDLIYKK